MKNALAWFAAAGLSVLSAGGCMHGVMMGHGARHDAAQTSAHSTAKEFDNPPIRLTLEAPPLFVRKENPITVRVEDIKSARFISGAHVVVAIQKQTEEPVYGPDLAAQEQGGVYRLRYRFEEAGPHRITAKVWPEGRHKGEPLTVDAVQTVEDGRSHRRNTAFMVLGAIGMAAMMAVMMIL